MPMRHYNTVSHIRNNNITKEIKNKITDLSFLDLLPPDWTRSAIILYHSEIVW